MVDFGGHRYLLYSTYSDRFATRYRVWDSSSGSWLRPVQDELESHDVYALKTVSDGQRLYLVGWLSTRAGDRDSGHRQWGGDLVVHELVQRRDGTLGTQIPGTVAAQFDQRPVPFECRQGEWSLGGDERGASATYNSQGFGWCSVGKVNGRAMFEVSVDLGSRAEELGITVRAGQEVGAAYLLRLEPERGRVVFDRRPHRIDVPFDYDSDRSYVSAPDHEIERPLPRADGQIRCRVVVDGSAIVAYIGDVALTTRGYDLDGGEFGVYTANGTARFSSPSLGEPNSQS
jgi:beta-fructofuranosidase